MQPRFSPSFQITSGAKKPHLRIHSLSWHVGTKITTYRILPSIARILLGHHPLLHVIAPLLTYMQLVYAKRNEPFLVLDTRFTSKSWNLSHTLAQLNSTCI